MKNYFHILGLEAGATEDEIRKAYRSLAKKLHPDMNPGIDTRNQFVEIQQAYSFLINAAQRHNYELLLSEEKLDTEELERRERIYKLWVEHQQRKARTRDAMEVAYYSGKGSLFKRRFWSGVNLFYNVFFLILFGIIVVMPIVSYFGDQELPDHQRPFIFYLVPSLLGAVFIVFGYYYWFILKTDSE